MLCCELESEVLDTPPASDADGIEIAGPPRSKGDDAGLDDTTAPRVLADDAPPVDPNDVDVEAPPVERRDSTSCSAGVAAGVALVCSVVASVFKIIFTRGTNEEAFKHLEAVHEDLHGMSVHRFLFRGPSGEALV